MSIFGQRRLWRGESCQREVKESACLRSGSPVGLSWELQAIELSVDKREVLCTCGLARNDRRHEERNVALWMRVLRKNQR